MMRWPGFGRSRRDTNGKRTTAKLDEPLLSADEIETLAEVAGHLVLHLPDREVHDHHAGDWPSARLGRGLDFEEARPYAPGDDTRDMDWRTTARLGHPYVKTYREERRPMLHIVMDRGAAMRFGTRRRLKVTQAARLATLYAFAAAEANLALSATFWDKPDKELPPSHGRRGALDLALTAAEPAPPLAADAAEAMRDDDRLHRLAAELPRGTRLLLLSDFSWLTDGHEEVLATLAERCAVLAVRIDDPAERALPDVGLVPIHDLRHRTTVWLDTGDRSVRTAHDSAFATRHAAIRDRLGRVGIRCIELGSEDDDLIEAMHRHA